MSVPSSPAPGDDGPKEAADASWLMSDAPEVQASSGTPAPGPVVEPGDQYDLGPPAEDVVAPVVEPIANEPPPRKAREAEAKARASLEPSEAVEQVWTRSAEWGPTVVLLAAVAFVLFVLVYALIANELFGPAVIVLLAGGLGLAFLAYPILITLERPVRMTPEQAIKDYYGALSHHFPHYRRMWLLLSTAGRTSGSFASFEGFSKYWSDRLAQLRGDRVSSFTPLKFQVVDFKSEKSAGVSEISVQFKLEISARGQSDQGPIASIPMQMDLVRGPDRMWYLDKGTIPNS